AEGACTLQCSASADACGGTASCDGVGSLTVNVCQPKKAAPSQSDPPDPKSQPKLSCSTDAECSKLESGAVCAEWHGEHDCTIKCTEDSQCNPPAVGGVSIDFLACQADEGNKSRMV